MSVGTARYVGTAKFAGSEKSQSKPGVITGPGGRWQFTYELNQIPLVSSQRKLVYQGTFVGDSLHGPIAARALAFERESVVAFGIECANLGRLASLCVGPRLLAVSQHDFGTFGGPCPIIIEEDAGESLATLLGAARENGRVESILHAKGTPERVLEDQKILYDVFVQVQNAHQAGIYHRDLRCENVCVRRFGEAPADIRATVIDFELGVALGGGEPNARAPLFRTLFCEVPSRILGEVVTLCPNPLELDMGYLAALQYHVERGELTLNGESHASDELSDFVEYLAKRVGYFGYRGSLPPHVRHLNTALDIDGIAQELKLIPVNEEAFASEQLLTHARSFHRPYLDAEDMRVCMGGPEARLAEMIDDIVAAKFESYKALRKEQGLEVEYERYDEQPMSLQRSNYAQAEHIPAKVRALGYLLVSEYDSKSYEEVTSFSDEQIEALARLEHDRWMDERLLAGWTLAANRDPVALTSPYLVPYDKLPEKIKDYDRDPARQLIDLVKRAGLVVVRPK